MGGVGRNSRGWQGRIRDGRIRHGLLAVAATLLINLALFSLIPQLIQAPTSPVASLLPSPASVVRVVPPPPPPRRQTPPEPQPPAAPQPQPPRPPASSVAPPQPALSLNLQLRPQLPTGVAQVVVPEVQLAQLEPLPAVFDSTALDKPLTALAQSPFVYPLRAKRLGIEGWVRVKLLISTTGEVEQVEILDAQPHDVFESTVERGVRQWRFSPGTVHGEPVRSWVVTTIRFELES